MRHDSITAGSDRPMAAERTSPTVSGTVTGPRRGRRAAVLGAREPLPRKPRAHRSQAHDADGLRELHARPSRSRLRRLRARGDHDRADRGVHRRQAPGGEGGQEHPQLPRALHAMFAFAVRRGWCARNPVALVEKPRGRRNLDIRFLDVQELEALLAATPTDERGTTERVLYLTAAMTGLRRGELLALRWQDIDWTAGVVRVRRNYTRGQFGTPKSRRSSRAVPLAQRVRDELQLHYERSRFQAPADLVFCHPQLGVVLDPAKLRRRFQAAARRAGLRPVRFHDLPPHIRHPHGRRRRALAMDPGMARTQRLPNHHALRRLRTRPLASRLLGRTRLRQRLARPRPSGRHGRRATEMVDGPARELLGMSACATLASPWSRRSGTKVLRGRARSPPREAMTAACRLLIHRRPHEQNPPA